MLIPTNAQNITHANSNNYPPTQLSQRLQCDALGGRNSLQVKQYFNFTTCPFTTTSFVRGGGRYVPGEPALGTSEKIRENKWSNQQNRIEGL